MFLDPVTRDIVDLPDTLTLTLDPPLAYQQASYAELALQEPNLSQVAAAHRKLDDASFPSSAAQREYELTLLALVSGKPREAMNGLRASDIRRGVAYLEAFVSARLDPPDQDAPECVLPLRRAVKGRAGEIHEITLTEPTGGALLDAERLLGSARPPLPGPVRAYQQRLIEKTSGLAAMEAGQLAIRDARLAVMFLEHFEMSAPATT